MIMIILQIWGALVIVIVIFEFWRDRVRAKEEERKRQEFITAQSSAYLAQWQRKYDEVYAQLEIIDQQLDVIEQLENLDISNLSVDQQLKRRLSILRQKEVLTQKKTRLLQKIDKL